MSRYTILTSLTIRLHQNVTIIGTGRAGKNPAALCIDHVNFKPQLHLLPDLLDVVDANVDTRVLLTHLPLETLAKAVEEYAHDSDHKKIKEENKTISHLREQCQQYAEEIEEERREKRKLESELKLERNALDKEKKSNHKLSSKLALAQEDLEEMRQRWANDEDKIESLKHENERLKRNHSGSVGQASMQCHYPTPQASPPSCYLPSCYLPTPQPYYPQQAYPPPNYSYPPQACPPSYSPPMQSAPFGSQPFMPPSPYLPMNQFQYPYPFTGPASPPSRSDSSEEEKPAKKKKKTKSH